MVRWSASAATSAPPASSPADGWPIRVTDWQGSDRDAEGETIAIFDGALATSSTTVRRWLRGDEVVHHLVDPTTGTSAPEVWRTVSVAAANCVDANVASTASIILGEVAPDWLESTGLPARLVRSDGEVLHLNGWGQPVAPASVRGCCPDECLRARHSTKGALVLDTRFGCRRAC